MKKISLITLCFVLLFGVASLAYAELPANRIALGVQLGASVSQVRNVFGVPDRTTKEQMKSEAYGDFVETTMIYGNNSIVVKFYDENYLSSVNCICKNEYIFSVEAVMVYTVYLDEETMEIE